MEAQNHKLYSRTSDDCFARVEGLCLRVLRETGMVDVIYQMP